jgi:hypothetical protein
MINESQKKMAFVVGGCIALAIIILLVCTMCTKETEKKVAKKKVVSYEKPLQQQQQHVVKKGQFLFWIAGRYNVDPEALLLANEEFLKSQYEEVCGRLSKKYRTRSTRRGLFCNDRLNRPYGNTLLPGNVLTIPSTVTDEVVSAVVESFEPGSSVALVIDDTGSMTDNRKQVADLYMASMREFGSNLKGIWLYADDQIRYFQGGNVKFRNMGNTENTLGALKEASKADVDYIILISDEKGDDFTWNEEINKLPKVIAHCLESSECEGNFRRLATETGGRYMSMK